MECIVKKQVKEVLIGIVNSHGTVVATEWVDPVLAIPCNNIIILRQVISYELIEKTSMEGGAINE